MYVYCVFVLKGRVEMETSWIQVFILSWYRASKPYPGTVYSCPYLYRKKMKLLLLFSTLFLGCGAAGDFSDTEGEPHGSFIKEALTCSSPSDEEGYCERPQNEETLKRLTQDDVQISMSDKSTKEKADSTVGKTHTDEQAAKSPAMHTKVSRNVTCVY